VSTLIADNCSLVDIRLGGNTTAKLFGLPFLLIGGYLGYQLVGGVFDIVTGRAALAEMLAGTLILIVMTAAFLVPGWLLIFTRARIEIDRVAGTVTSVRDLRVYKFTDRRPLSEFESVEVDVLTVSTTNRSPSTSYQVELASPTRKNIVVGLFDDGDAAMEYAVRLGPSIGLPVKDLREVEPEVED
jgi:hypothetical protein